MLRKDSSEHGLQTSSRFERRLRIFWVIASFCSGSHYSGTCVGTEVVIVGKRRETSVR